MHTNGTTPKDVAVSRYVSLAAGTIGAMFGEFELAVQTGMSPWFAAAYPLALDAYAYVAFRTGRKAHVVTALMLMGISQGATHLISAHILPMCWPVVVLVWAVILPLVICLTHNVTHTAAGVAEPAGQPDGGTVDAEPVDEPAQVDELPQDEPPTGTPAPAAEWIGPGRRNWRMDDAKAFVREHSHLSVPELAARMNRTERQVRTYKRAALATA